jgi:hypothetical protein
MLEDGVDASEVFGDGDGHLDTLREGVDIITIIESLFFNYISCVMHQEDRAEKNPIISNSKFDGNSHTPLTHRNVIKK